MTEQPPSAEAREIADNLWPLAEVLRLGLARDIDALVSQRVSADRAERPAPAGGYVIEVEFDDGKEAQRAYDAIEGLLGEMGQLGTLGMRPIPSALASTGEQPAPEGKAGPMRFNYFDGQFREASVPESGDRPLTQDELAAFCGSDDEAVVDYTERARGIVASLQADCGLYHTGAIGTIAAALSAVAAERDAAAIRAFGQRVWSDTEEVAYQAGVSDTRARLQEPDVREAAARAMADAYAKHSPDDWGALAEADRDAADAALTRIAEMLK